MARVGVTGHVRLAQGTAALIHRALREALAPFAGPDLVGVTCLAAGSDQIFARAVLDLGGRIEVVLPAADYREAGIEAEDRVDFDSLIDVAAAVFRTGYDSSGPDAYRAASEVVIGRSERLLAVWDGSTDEYSGGTGDAVARARSIGVPVEVVWPAGAQRSRPRV